MESLLGQEFETMDKARDMIKDTIISTGFSYKKIRSNQSRYILVYKDSTCIIYPFILLQIVIY